MAVTVDQFWAPVPGGTATSLARFLQAHERLPAGERSRLIPVSAAHRRPAADQFRIETKVRRLPLPRPVLFDTWRLLRLPPVELVTGRVDVLHATTMAIPPATRPLVVTVHDLAFLNHPEHYTSRGNRFFRAGLERTRRHARLVLVPSAHTRDECVQAGIAPERIRVVPWGVEPRRADPDAVRRVRTRFGLNHDYVLWCGTAEPRKNLPGLLAAFAQVAAREAGIDLVLVGPKGWGDAQGAGPRPPAERVHTLGFVDDADLVALYTGAEAFCYPSIEEGFGLPVLEAMGAGTPVVTSTGTPMAELVGAAGLAESAHDPTALAQALLTVLRRRDDFAAAAGPRAAAFSWEATARATEQAYRDAAAG
ncbi:MAG: glycosyltransferase family 4 protein [Actinomycetales bacterium]